MSAWGTTVERETRRRIELTMFAFAYELDATSLVDDAVFDRLAIEVDLSINTTRPDLDAWWRANFQPYTGSWIYRHPELERVRRVYLAFYKDAARFKTAAEVSVNTHNGESLDLFA